MQNELEIVVVYFGQLTIHMMVFVNDLLVKSIMSTDES